MDSDREVPLSQLEMLLLELMQELRYGRIESLVVRSGEPVIDASTQVLRDVKFGQETGESSTIAGHVHLDKPQVTSMLEQFHKLGNGTVRFLDVHDGLPFRMRIAHSARP